ncbi:MAG: phosphoglycolate phosphatase [Pseudomonadota bacterium]
MTKPPCIIFDLDGTLVDSAPDLTATGNELLRRRGRDEVSLADVRSMVGKGALVLMERMMAATGEPATREEVKAMLPEFLEHYGANIAAKTAPFPGVREALATLAERQALMAVCTNKFEQLSHSLLQQIDLDHHFSAVVGGDTLPIRKPDGGHVLGTIERAGGDRARTIMVGDSHNDIDAAKDAGVKSIAVSFGYTDIPPKELGADHVIDHFDELIGAIDALME